MVSVKTKAKVMVAILYLASYGDGSPLPDLQGHWDIVRIHSQDGLNGWGGVNHTDGVNYVCGKQVAPKPHPAVIDRP